MSDFLLGYISAYKNLSCPRDPQQAARGRRIFLSEAKSLLKDLEIDPRQKKRRRLVRTPAMGKRSLSPVLLSLMIAAGLMLGTLTGTVYASQDSLPNDQLYTLKIFSEEVRLRFAFQEEKKIALHTKFFTRRVDEIFTLTRQGQPIPGQVLSNLEIHQENLLTPKTFPGRDPISVRDARPPDRHQVPEIDKFDQGRGKEQNKGVPEHIREKLEKSKAPDSQGPSSEQDEHEPPGKAKGTNKQDKENNGKGNQDKGSKDKGNQDKGDKDKGNQDKGSKDKGNKNK